MDQLSLRQFKKWTHQITFIDFINVPFSQLPFWETLRSWLQIPPFQRKVWIPAVAGVAIVLLITIPLLFKKTPSYPSLSVVEYVESQTHNVMIYESENAKVTVIWLFEEPEKETPSS